MKDTEAAFRWIIGVLERRQVPFRISGGLAVRAYGSERPLADIDIDIPDDKFVDILDDVKSYIVRGPERLLDDNWDIYLMVLNFKGQDIDICSATAKIKDRVAGKWIDENVDLSKFETKELYGLKVPIIPKQELIIYKTKLAREVDLEDVLFLKKN